MKNIEIIDRDYNRLCWISNEPEKGLHYYNDYLSTSIDTGVYTLEFIVPKRVNDGVHNHKMQYLKEGNYLRFMNRQNVLIMMTIKQITDNRDHKQIYAEDTSLTLKNSMLEGMETPLEPQLIDFYLEPVLERAGFLIGKNESDDKKIVELTSNQNALERLRQIVQAFGLEFYFSVEFIDLQQPLFKLNVVKRRLEGTEGFIISSDSLVKGIERFVDADNIITKLTVRGRAKEVEQAVVTETAPVIPPVTVLDDKIEAVITKARQQLGKPYLWAANGPNSFDCSGFVSYSFRQAGYPGYPTSGRPNTYSMWNGEHSGYFTKISKADLKRGDIIMYDTKYVQTRPNHVGIYLGDNQVIHAGSPVQIQGAFSMEVVGYLRVKG